METESLKVTGMTCDGRTTKVAKALKALNGVKDVVVSLAPAAAIVRLDERFTSPAELRSAVQQAGYGIGTGSGSRSYRTRVSCCG